MKIIVDTQTENCVFICDDQAVFGIDKGNISFELDGKKVVTGWPVIQFKTYSDAPPPPPGKSFLNMKFNESKEWYQ